MRLYFPRFTVRRLLILVAVTALAIQATRWGIEMRRLSREYGFEARLFGEIETLERDINASNKGGLLALRCGSGWPPFNLLLVSVDAAESADNLRYADHYHTKMLIFERAARYPWLPLVDIPLPLSVFRPFKDQGMHTEILWKGHDPQSDR